MRRAPESRMFTRRQRWKATTPGIHGKQTTVTATGKDAGWREVEERGKGTGEEEERTDELEKRNGRWREMKKKERRRNKDRTETVGRIRRRNTEEAEEEDEEEEEEESGFESLPTTRRDTCGRENLLCLWKARKWRGLLSPGTRSLPRTCRKVSETSSSPIRPVLPTHCVQSRRPWVEGRGGKVYLLLVAGEKKDTGNYYQRDSKKIRSHQYLTCSIEGKPCGGTACLAIPREDRDFKHLVTWL